MLADERRRGRPHQARDPDRALASLVHGLDQDELAVLVAPLRNAQRIGELGDELLLQAEDLRSIIGSSQANYILCHASTLSCVVRRRTAVHRDPLFASSHSAMNRSARSGAGRAGCRPSATSTMESMDPG